MARVGVSYPRYAIYHNNGGTVTYSDGGSMGKATSWDMDINGSDNNILYADNGPAESAKTFTGGTLKIGTDDLYDDASIAMLGIEKNEITEPAPAVELVESADQETPFIGTGGVIKHIRDGKTCYTGVVLTKVQVATPSESITTQGENIVWQTPEIEATIFRDDTAKKVWRRKATFDTETHARAYVDGILNIPASAPSGGQGD